MEYKRKQWIDAMCKIVTPVLDMLEQGKLKQSLPLTFHEERKAFAPLEAFGRSMLGLAPWLEADSEILDEEERTRQAVYRAKAVRCIEMATNPESPDFMLFDEGGQPLVDAAFLAHVFFLIFLMTPPRRSPSLFPAPHQYEYRNFLLLSFL